MATITERELLEALAEAAKGSAPKDAKTIAEIAAEAGVGIRAVRTALAVFKSQGRLGVHTLMRPALDDRLVRVPGYTITPKPRR